MRKFLLKLGLLLLLFFAAVGLLLYSPVVQKAIFLFVLRSKVEEVSVEKVRFTFSSFEMQNFKLADQGISVSTDRAVVKASWMDLIRRRKVHIEEITVNELEADLVVFASASGGGLGVWLDLLGESEGPWEGILAKMKPSTRFSIAQVRVDGRAILPDRQLVDLNLSLDDLDLGQQAKLHIQGGFLDAGGNSPVDQAVYDVVLNLDQSGTGTMNGVNGTVSLEMLGAELNPGGKLNVSGRWTLSRTANGEKLSVLLLETGKPVPLLDAEWDTDIQSGQLEGRLSANLNGALVPVSLLGLPQVISTATFTTQGQAGWNYKQGVGQFDLQGSGILQERPWEYQVSGTGTADQLPVMTGFVKTGFADEAGAGDLIANLDVNPKGAGRIIVPIEVKRGDQLSKLLVTTDIPSLKLDPFNITLDGETVYLADLQSVGTALAAWGYGMQQLDAVAEASAETIEKVVVDKAPWEGISGNATLSVDRLILPEGYTLEGLKAQASVSADSVSLTSFNTWIDSGSLRGKGVLLYTAGSEIPFTLRGEGTMANVPSDLFDLGSGAPITGNWNGSVSLVGQARELEQLADAIELSMDVEGSNGLLQLTRIDEKANQTAQIVNLGAMLFGQLMKDARYTAVSQMTQYLQNVPYDSIRIQMDRSASGKVSIQNFSILGPELMLAGSGSVDAQSWNTLLQGTLAMNLTMGTKGTFGDSAKSLGLTGPELNGEYQLWKQPINISGTLDNPNYSALKDMIFNALK